MDKSIVARTLAVLGLALGLIACGSDDGGGTPPAPGATPEALAPANDAKEPFAVIPPDWKACSLVTGASDGNALCATVMLPRDHAAGAGSPTIPIALKRIRASTPRRGTVWLLDGGPGLSATDRLAGLAGDLPRRVRDLDYVAIDHRGVGGSERLDCPTEEKATSDEGEDVSDAEWSKCAAKLQEREGGLGVFTTTATAKDLGALIAATKVPGERAFVWGGSYGTYLALRYLQIFPDQPDGVILEGIAPPGFGFETFDADLNEAAKNLFQACAADTACKAHLGDDPFATAREVITSLDRGHCRALRADGRGLQAFIGSLLYSERIRGSIPALIHRIQRCTAADVEAINHLVGVFAGASATEPGATPLFFKGAPGDGGSIALKYSVVSTELWPESGPSEATVEKELAGLVITSGTTMHLAKRFASWPRVAPDAYHGKLPDYRKPLLMLQGGLDPATPAKHAASLERHFNAPNQTWALFPAAAHDPTRGTLLPEGDSCALQLYVSFLRNPDSALDTSCIAHAEGPTFLSDPQSARALLGKDDAWE